MVVISACGLFEIIDHCNGRFVSKMLGRDMLNLNDL